MSIPDAHLIQSCLTTDQLQPNPGLTTKPCIGSSFNNRHTVINSKYCLTSNETKVNYKANPHKTTNSLSERKIIAITSKNLKITPPPSFDLYFASKTLHRDIEKLFTEMPEKIHNLFYDFFQKLKNRIETEFSHSNTVSEDVTTKEYNTLQKLLTEFYNNSLTELNRSFSAFINEQNELSAELKTSIKESMQNLFYECCSNHNDDVLFKSSIDNQTIHMDDMKQFIQKTLENFEARKNIKPEEDELIKTWLSKIFIEIHTGFNSDVEYFNPGLVPLQGDFDRGSIELNKKYVVKKQTFSDAKKERIEMEYRTFNSLKLPAKCYRTTVKDGYHYALMSDAGENLLEYPISIVKSGNLFDLDSILTRHILNQISCQVRVMHENKIIHNDIKTENIVIQSGTGKISLIDFGFADQNDDNTSSYADGTYQYYAPEKVNPGEKHTNKADVFSLGVLFSIVLTADNSTLNPVNENTFVSQDEYESQVIAYKKSIMSSRFPSHKAKELIGKMLEVDPDNRISIEDVCNHPFFSEDQETIISLTSDYNDGLQELAEHQEKELSGRPDVTSLINKLDSLKEKMHKHHQTVQKKNEAARKKQVTENAICHRRLEISDGYVTEATGLSPY